MTRSISLSGLVLIALMMPWFAMAQNTPDATPQSAEPSRIRSQLEAIGNHLEDDRVDMYSRYVYDDAQTIGKNVPLNLPVLTNQDVIEWLTEHVAVIMTVSPNVSLVHQRQIAPYFTEQGLLQLGAQWKQAGIASLVNEQRYSMSALVTDGTTILAKGRQKEQDGRVVYRWIVDVPILLNYIQENKTSQAFPLTLRVGVARIALQPSGQLIAIDSWAIAPKPKQTPKDSEN